MTSNYHTPLTVGAPANAATVNAPLAQLDSAIAGLATNTTLMDYVLSTGGPITQANGAASAAQKVVTVDDSTGFLGGCFVEYALATGVIERNTVATVDSGTQITLGTNIGTGGIANNALIAVIPVSQYYVQPRREHTVYCLGDSLTATATYPARLETNLGVGWSVLNKGLSGNTTTQMAARLTADIVQAGDAEYVVVLGGINDIAQGVDAATIETNLQTIYTAIAAAGVKVVACTITPFKGNTNWTAGKQTVLDTVNAWILGTATGIDYAVDTYDALEDGTSDTLVAAYDGYGDWLHLSTAGYNMLADTIYAGATWAYTATPATLTLNNDISLNQSLRTTDSVTFGNLFVSDTLNMPVWKPKTDSTSALRINNSAGSYLMTFDTTNLVAAIGATPDANVLLNASTYNTATTASYGIKWAGGKDGVASGTAYGISAETYNYAISDDSSCDNVIGLLVGIGGYADSGKTAATTGSQGINVIAPGFSGAGTKTIGTHYGIHISNQGNAAIGVSVGLVIDSQSGSASNWAFASGAGIHQFGDSAATIGFYGVTPIARATLATGAGATVDNVITALQNLGLVKQS